MSALSLITLLSLAPWAAAAPCTRSTLEMLSADYTPGEKGLEVYSENARLTAQNAEVNSENARLRADNDQLRRHLRPVPDTPAPGFAPGPVGALNDLQFMALLDLLGRPLVRVE